MIKVNSVFFVSMIGIFKKLRNVGYMLYFLFIGSVYIINI